MKQDTGDMKYAMVLMIMGSLRGLADAGNFEVNGDFQAGASEGNGQRSFTIKAQELAQYSDYTAAALDSSFDPDDAVVTHGKVKFTHTKTSSVKANSTRSDEQGMKYKHFIPRAAGDSRMYLPNTENTFIHDSGAPILLEGWIRKTFVADIKKELKQTQNAIRVLGALLGLDMKTMREVLTFDRETMAFVESIKAGTVPVYIPGDLFVAKSAEINTNDSEDMPSFCDAWSGTGQNGTKGTTDWVLQDLMGYGTSEGAKSSGVKIKTATAGQIDETFDADSSAARRWDDPEAFASDKQKRDDAAGGEGFEYRAADTVESNLKAKYTMNDFENTDFNDQELDYTNVFGAASSGTPLEKRARYSTEVIDAIEKEVDACKVVI